MGCAVKKAEHCKLQKGREVTNRSPIGKKKIMIVAAKNYGIISWKQKFFNFSLKDLKTISSIIQMLY